MSGSVDPDANECTQSGIPILNIPNLGASAVAVAANASGDGDDFAEEECDVLVGQGQGDGVEGRCGKLALKALLHEGLVEPGEGVMSIDYLGQTFKGDLLSCGKIRCQETGFFFTNPSAWTISCKKIVNPAKRSGCGWSSVKYKGRKMDQFKAIWLKNDDDDDNVRNPDVDAMASRRLQLPVIRHDQLSAKHPDDDTNVLMELESFESSGVGKMQPFHVSVSSSAMLLVDLHSHLSPDPVCGYLAGHWDLNAHNLAVTHAYPCMTATTDPEVAKRVEADIHEAIYSKHLMPAGWYKTTLGGRRALPSIRDAEAQLDNQIRLLGSSDATYTPCVGMIVCPYASGSIESDVAIYWVAPPPPTPDNVHPQEYGRPMRMNASTVVDPCLSQQLLDQIERLILHYKRQPEQVPFKRQYNSDTKYITKMGRSLLPKFSRDQDDRLWKYIRVLILGDEEKHVEDPLIRKLALATNGGGVGKCCGRRRKTQDSVEEEEIDDDEENALRSCGNGHEIQQLTDSVSLMPMRSSLAKATAAPPPPPRLSSAVEVIPHFLTKLPPPPRAAHSVALKASVPSGAAIPAPLDFSSSSSIKAAPDPQQSTANVAADDDSDEDRLMIHE